MFPENVNIAVAVTPTQTPVPSMSPALPPLPPPPRPGSAAAEVHHGVARVHTDLIRPEMWPKLNAEKTTEAMPVVSISLNYVSPAHLAVKKNLT